MSIKFGSQNIKENSNQKNFFRIVSKNHSTLNSEFIAGGKLNSMDIWDGCAER